ncbi:neutral zinc metallopeptidase [bacterium]|nr:neutral zinc metallopeptidase [bacterium]
MADQPPLETRPAPAPWFRRLAVVALVALGATACAGNGGVFVTTTVSEGTTTLPQETTATSSPGSAATSFPRGAVEAYLEGCAGDGDTTFCTCSIREFQERLTFDEFLALDETDLSDSAVVTDVTSVCLREVVAATSTTTIVGATTTTTTVPPMTLDLDGTIAVAVSDLEAYWAEQMPIHYQVEYRPIGELIPYYPSTGDLPRCGAEDLSRSVYEDNAFYCNPNDFIAWDAEGLIPDLFEEFGDFAVSLVMAHEWGHAVQNRGSVRGPTIVTELQADCFAGAWTGAAAAGDRTLRLSPGDLEEAMAGYLLFRDPPGTSPNDEGAHGTGFDRLNAFQDGFFDGVAACVPYVTSSDVPEIVAIPITPEDVATGGDLPFDDIAPLLGDSLEAFWTITYPEIFDGDWVPVSTVVPYFPSTGDLPACGFGVLDPSEYEYNAFYCPDGDFIAWDAEELFPDLYRSIGDFGIGMVLGNQWALAALTRAGLPIEGVEAELRADCLAGSWTAMLVPFENPTGIVLSAGDLDEGISGFLTLGADPSAGDVDQATPFDRFNAFQQGFFSGAASCLDQ